MVMKKVIKCPKCGSTDLDWHKGSRGDTRICHACGHMGNFVEEWVDEESGEEIWP